MKKVFISYRNINGGLETAKMVKDFLVSKGYDAYLDEELSSGEYRETLLRCVEECDHFVLVMPKDAFKEGTRRDKKSRDIYIDEIEHAIKNKKNIIPIAMSNFEEADYRFLPKELVRSNSKKGFLDIEVVTYDTKTIDNARERLLLMLKGPGKPLDIDIEAEIKSIEVRKTTRKKRLCYGGVIVFMLAVVVIIVYLLVNMTFIPKYDRQVQDEYLVCMGARVSESDEWNKSLVKETKAHTGDVVHFQIHFENSTGASMKDVMVGVNMPENLRYVNDSVMLYNATNPDGIPRDNTLITVDKSNKSNNKSNIVNEKPKRWFSDGVNIGGYEPYGDAYVRFDAVVVDDYPGTYRVWCNVSADDYYVVQYSDIEVVNE